MVSVLKKKKQERATQKESPEVTWEPFVGDWEMAARCENCGNHVCGPYFTPGAVCCQKCGGTRLSVMPSRWTGLRRVEDGEPTEWFPSRNVSIEWLEDSDRTGLCNVREWAGEILSRGGPPFEAEIVVPVGGQKINMVCRITHIDGQLVLVPG